ncbi:hypothetical protein [Actinoplanes subtropicus]|uniref:hypothetical protein n=1 Tax=Actinoplanes subtropicus TaxID=543632 RepID=UPI0012F7C070|nr:hypothetical protein [Actinoplanes subtropicus]
MTMHDVEIDAEGVTLRGRLFRPDADGPRRARDGHAAARHPGCGRPGHVRRKTTSKTSHELLILGVPAPPAVNC